MDFLSHAVNRIRIRGIQVYVWMPVLSFELPDKDLNERLKVRELKDGEIKTTSSWYRRLTPFDPRSLAIVKSLYQDLAAHVRFDGVLFQDDAYLTDYEDFHPAALKAFRERYGSSTDPMQMDDDRVRQQWMQLKTETMDLFIGQLIETVQQYRPFVKTARNIYSIVMLNPHAQEWFSQNFETYLENYDYTVIMAYPQMEQVRDSGKIKNWFSRLVNIVDQKNAREKVIFKVQGYDWEKDQWINADLLKKELRFLAASGAWHLSYYPDNVFENRPDLDQLSSMISARTFPRAWSLK
jgi:biofilm PGA synthesis lipoprotein PgaB